MSPSIPEDLRERISDTATFTDHQVFAYFCECLAEENQELSPDWEMWKDILRSLSVHRPAAFVRTAVFALINVLRSVFPLGTRDLFLVHMHWLSDPDACYDELTRAFTAHISHLEEYKTEPQVDLTFDLLVTIVKLTRPQLLPRILHSTATLTVQP